MHRESLLSKLNNYRPTDANELNIRLRLIEFIRGNEHCFESCHPPVQGQECETSVGHITGSAWVLNSDKTKVLLTHHKKLNKWLQLGGHSDGEADVQKTAHREAIEESGIKEIKSLSSQIFDLDIHSIPARKGVAPHLHYDVRFLFWASSDTFIVSAESNDLKWIELDQMTLRDFEESLVRMAHKSLKFLKNEFLHETTAAAEVTRPAIATEH